MSRKRGQFIAIKPGDDDKPVAFHEIPASYMPFEVEMFDEDTGKVFHTVQVDGPGVIDIPSRTQHGYERVGVRIKYNGGMVATTHSDGTTEFKEGGESDT